MAALSGSPSSPADALKPLTKVTWISSCTFAAGVNAFAITTVSDVGVLGQTQQQQQLLGRFSFFRETGLPQSFKK